MHPLTKKHATVGSAHIDYLEREASEGPTGPPILLLHALLATADTLHELIAALPANSRILAIDLPSAQPVDPSVGLRPQFAVLTEFVRRFIKSTGLVQPIVIGHSHGGVLALCLAATERNLLKGLVLLCPAHPFGGYRPHVVDFYLKQPGRMLALSIPLAPSWMILRAYNQAAGSKSRIRMHHLRPHLRVLRNRNTLRRILQILKTWDADMAALQQAMTASPIGIPTLLIWGDEDPVVPISSAAELEDHLLDHERVTLKGMGHLLIEEAPVACAEAIRTWLIDLDARG